MSVCVSEREREREREMKLVASRAHALRCSSSALASLKCAEPRRRSLTFLRSPLLFLFAHGAVLQGLLVKRFGVRQPQAHSECARKLKRK